LAFFSLFSPLRRTKLKKKHFFKKNKKGQKTAKNTQKQRKQLIFEKGSFFTSLKFPGEKRFFFVENWVFFFPKIKIFFIFF
jgi:hypothetical protein